MTARLALVLDNLSVGGTQRMTLNLARALVARGAAVDLVLLDPGGALRAAVPAGVEVFDLPPSPGKYARRLALRMDPWGIPALVGPVLAARKVPSALRAALPLAQYLWLRRPAALLSAKTFPNLAALWARRIAGVPTRVVITERTHLSARTAAAKTRWRGAPALVRRYYRHADAVVAVSAGVASDLVARSGLPGRLVQVVDNPVIGPDFAQRAAAPVNHPWLQGGDLPVLLAVGALTAQKDLPTLLRAFAQVRARRPARLLVLGEGRQRDRLVALARGLGIANDVDLPGTVACPEAYMARAAMLVLSSCYEGFGNVIVEALAAGCPVVATDCPSGPAEILAGGRYGRLVPVGDVPALASAIGAQLDATPDRALLRARGGRYTVDRAADAYLKLLTAAPAPGPLAVPILER